MTIRARHGEHRHRSLALRYFPAMAGMVSLYLLGAGCAWAPELAEDQDAGVTPRIELLLDGTGALTLQDLLRPEYQDAFTPHEGASVNAGLGDKPIWLRATVRNTSREERWVLEVQNPRLFEAVLFEADAEGAWNHRRMGMGHDPGLRDYSYPSPAFRVTLPENEERTFYLRVSHHGSMRFRLLIWPEHRFAHHLTAWTAVIFLINGILIAIAFYSLIIYLDIRDMSYLYHSLLVGLFLLWQATRCGTTGLYLWPNTPWWADHSVNSLAMLTVSVNTIFANHVIRPHIYAPRMRVILVGLATAAALTALFSLTDLVIKYRLSHLIGLAAPAAALFTAYLARRQGYRPAGFYLWAWLAVLPGAVVFVLLGLGYLPSNPVTEHILEIVCIAAMLLWTFALTDRVKIEEAEARRRLEEAVNRRTAELQTALDQVETLSGLLPICSHCKKIRDDQGYWKEVEHYIGEHTEADFSHGLCPQCVDQLYPGLAPEDPGSTPSA